MFKGLALAYNVGDEQGCQSKSLAWLKRDERNSGRNKLNEERKKNNFDTVIENLKAFKLSKQLG